MRHAARVAQAVVAIAAIPQPVVAGVTGAAVSAHAASLLRGNAHDGNALAWGGATGRGGGSRVAAGG